MTTGLIFGTFDGLHAGHVAFLEEARQHAQSIAVSIPSDEVVEKMKSHRPKFPRSDRAMAVQLTDHVDAIYESDAEPGSFSIIDTVKPDVIILGYDQTELKAAIEHWLAERSQNIPLVVLKPHQPDVYKSSLLNAI